MLQTKPRSMSSRGRDVRWTQASLTKRDKESQRTSNILMCTKPRGATVGGDRVDVTKNSDGEAIVRIRLVARDYWEKVGKRDDSFVATPFLHRLRALLVLSFSGA